MHFQVVEEGWRLKKVGWDTGHRKKPGQWGLYRRSVNKLISYEQTVYDQSGLGFKYLMPEWGFRHLCLLNQFLVQFITNTGNTIKIKTVSGDELYFYSPQESELLNYVQVCSSFRKFNLQWLLLGLCGIYRHTNYNDLQSLASRYFLH